MVLIISPDAHAALTREAARYLTVRDIVETGNGRGFPRMSRVDRIQLEAAARVDASRLVDRLVDVLGGRTALTTPDKVVLA